MNSKPNKKLSVGAGSYVTIAWKGVFTQSQVHCKYPMCALPSWAPCFCTFFGHRVRKLKNTYAVEFIYSKLSYLILVCLQHDAVHHMSEKQPEYSGTPTGMQKKKLLYLLESWAKLRHLLQKKKEINALRIADSSKQAKRESPLHEL